MIVVSHKIISPKKTFCYILKSLIFDKLNTAKRAMETNPELSTF